MKNKEGKEESSKRGTTESEKREGEMTNKVEKEKPWKNHKKVQIPKGSQAGKSGAQFP